MLNALTTKAYVKVTEAIRSFKENQNGVTAIEYGLIAVAVAAMIVVVFYNQGGFIDGFVLFGMKAPTLGWLCRKQLRRMANLHRAVFMVLLWAFWSEQALKSPDLLLLQCCWF